MGMAQETVVICMATYNGEKYIEEQLISIINQSYSNWHLFIRDDGSSDRTREIEIRYKENYPDKINLLDKKEGKAGSKYNFAELCKTVLTLEYKYVMFCDQDDVWKKDKIEQTLGYMKQIEEAEGNVPVLIHTDLEVVDYKLNCLGNSFMKYRALNPNCTSIERLLVQNNITGCTMMINRKLLEKSAIQEVVDDIAMHDWWFAIVTSIFGKIGFVNSSTIKYRQHEQNVVGATKVNSIRFIMERLRGKNHVKKTLDMSILQAQEVLKLYSAELDTKTYKVVYALAHLKEFNKCKRIYTVLKYHLLKQGYVQIIGELLFI